MKILSMLALAIFAFAGCHPAAEATFHVSNPGYTVDRLFSDSNGVTIYRFYDQGDYRYYLVGPAGAQMLPTTTHITETDTIYVDGSDGHRHR